MHRWFHRIMARRRVKKRGRVGEGVAGEMDVRFFFYPFKGGERGEKCQTQQRRGLDPLSSSSSSLNVTQHLFHIYDGGAASPMPPSTLWRFYLCLGLPPLPTDA